MVSLLSLFFKERSHNNVTTELNVREIRPPNMDDSGRTKYPVLFHPFVLSSSMTINNDE